MGVQRWVLAWLYLNLLYGLEKASCLSALQRSQLKCSFLRGLPWPPHLRLPLTLSPFPS